MKYFIYLLLVIGFTACQKSRYFTSGPEVDLAKKTDEAYFKGDWTTLRSYYADTAKIVVNIWSNGGMSPDEFIEDLKSGVANYSSYKQGPDAFYEAVIDDKGETYVHSWQLWTGTHKSGKEVNVVVNISAHVAGGKIVWAGVIYDTHALIEAEKGDSTAAVMK